MSVLIANAQLDAYEPHKVGESDYQEKRKADGPECIEKSSPPVLVVSVVQIVFRRRFFWRPELAELPLDCICH